MNTNIIFTPFSISSHSLNLLLRKQFADHILFLRIKTDCQLNLYKFSKLIPVVVKGKSIFISVTSIVRKCPGVA